MFKNAKVGDKVWSFEYGWGVIYSINKKGPYPLDVNFNGEWETYTFSGEKLIGANQTLFWDEIKFEIPPKPMPDLPVDTKVLVWGSGMQGYKKKRYFSHFKEGRIYCFLDGKTSWNCDLTNCWENWELAED